MIRTKFKIETIGIRVKRGVKKIEAEVFKGLALHPDSEQIIKGRKLPKDPTWTITHIKSSLRIIGPIREKKRAITLMLQLAELLDWNQSMKKVVKLGNAIQLRDRIDYWLENN